MYYTMNGMYRILFNGKWIYGYRKAVFDTERGAKISLNKEFLGKITDLLSHVKHNCRFLDLQRNFPQTYNNIRKELRVEAKVILDEMITSGLIVLEKIQ